jgi:MoxR-like ATPase
MDGIIAESNTAPEPLVPSEPEAGLKPYADILEAARGELAKRVVGQREMIDGLLMVLIAGGHILIEGTPGLAKTLAVKSLAEITGLSFKRIQFTPDLLPADLTGTLIWQQAAGTFSVRRGPVFANVILADEINRAPAKVQSSLLEAMEERQVTIGEASYPLPDAELDRFLFKLILRYPLPDEELAILALTSPFPGYGGEAQAPPLQPVLNLQVLHTLRRIAEHIHIDEQIARYIVSLVTATRHDTGKTNREGLYRYIFAGASPRASIALYRCSRIQALFMGRSFVLPEDVKAVALPVLRHRIGLSYEAEADGIDTDTVISRILSLVPLP